MRRNRKLLRRWFKCLDCVRWCEAEFKVYSCPECESSRIVERVSPVELTLVAS